MAGPARGRKPSVVVGEAVSESCSSGPMLARAFGSPIFEPAWWPLDAGEISYVLDRHHPHRVNYRIGSTRHDDIPICVIGRPEISGAGRASGEWYEPRELAHLRGVIGRTGDPPRLQAVVHHQQLAIHLLGYETEEEIINAAKSLRQIN